jgi:hypothetical protein
MDPAMRPVDQGWFGGVADRLEGLATEIRQERGREPDPGDLLIVLASTPDTVVSDLISELGVEPDRLAETLERLRRSRGERNRHAAIEKVRQEKEAAKESGDTALADRLRDEERRLTRELKSDQAAALDHLRIRLGVVDGKSQLRDDDSPQP